MPLEALRREEYIPQIFDNISFVTPAEYNGFFLSSSLLLETPYSSREKEAILFCYSNSIVQL
jgi:hypothetical protein